MVDGQAISMSTLDDTARAYCELTLRDQQSPEPLDNSEIRRQAINDLVLARIATDIANERGLKFPASVDVDPKQFVEEFGASRAPGVAAAISESRDMFNLFVVIGGQDAAIAVTEENSTDLAQAGFAVVRGAFADHDVKFAPRLGLADSGEPNENIGSLSVAPIGFEAPMPNELPGPLACRA